MAYAQPFIAVVLLGLLAGLVAPIKEFTGLDLDSLDRSREPTVQLDLKQPSGPILILVEYEIDQQDVPEFLELMAQCCRQSPVSTREN